MVNSVYNLIFFIGIIMIIIGYYQNNEKNTKGAK